MDLKDEFSKVADGLENPSAQAGSAQKAGDGVQQQGEATTQQRATAAGDTPGTNEAGSPLKQGENAIEGDVINGVKRAI